MRCFLGASLLSAALALAGSVHADEAAFFRLGVGMQYLTPSPDTNNPGDVGDNEGGQPLFTYPLAAPAFGADITVHPVLPSGVIAYGYDWDQDVPDPSVVELDSVTGAVTWHAGFYGQQSVRIYAWTNPEMDWDISPTALGTSTANVPGGYAINVTPPSLTVQQGAMGLSQTFVATTSPPQPSTGEYDEWTVDYGGFGPFDAEHSPSITWTSNDFVNYGTQGYEAEIRFVRKDAAGILTYGPYSASPLLNRHISTTPKRRRHPIVSTSRAMAGPSSRSCPACPSIFHRCRNTAHPRCRLCRLPSFPRI